MEVLEIQLLPKKDPREKKIGHTRLCPFSKNSDQNSGKTEKRGGW
jgi:hypothetical protein